MHAYAIHSHVANHPRPNDTSSSCAHAITHIFTHLPIHTSHAHQHVWYFCTPSLIGVGPLLSHYRTPTTPIPSYQPTTKNEKRNSLTHFDQPSSLVLRWCRRSLKCCRCRACALLQLSSHDQSAVVISEPKLDSAEHIFFFYERHSTTH